MSETPKQSREQKALELIRSDKATDVVKGVKQLRQHGKSSSIYPVVTVLSETNDPEIQEAIILFLNDLRMEDAIETLVTCTQDTEFENVRVHLLQALWQSSIDVSEYLVEILSILQEATYAECVEVMTILDNVDGPFNGSELDEALGVVSEAMMSADEQKQQLLLAISEIIGTLPAEQ